MHVTVRTGTSARTTIPWCLALLLLLVLSPISHAAAHPGVGIVTDRRGNVFYTDLFRIWRITPDGRKSVVVPEVHAPALSIDSAGNVFGEDSKYMGDDKWRHRVWRLGADGRLTTVVKSLGAMIMGLHTDPRDNLYVAAWGDRAVLKVTPAGTVTTVVRVAEPWGPSGVLVAADGSTWLLETSKSNDVRVRRIAPNGRITSF